MEQQLEQKDKSIGDIIRISNNISPEQIQAILEYQKEKNVKFGEAAVALGYVDKGDVLWALAQQFQYPYTKASEASESEELLVANSPFSDAAERFRDLRGSLLSTVFKDGEQGSRRSLAVISTEVGEGKSFICANLAVAFSQLDGRTLIIDADMRSPRQHEIFNVDSGGGLSSILAGRAEPNVIRPVDSLPNLYLLPVGVVPPNPTELIQRPAFEWLLKELEGKFDYIVIDTPAASHGVDSRLLASKASATMAVVRRHSSRLDKVQKLLETIAKSGTKMAGILVNDYK